MELTGSLQCSEERLLRICHEPSEYNPHNCSVFN